MSLEVKILSGARAGQVLRFEQPVIAVGRHATSDLRFDPQQDLDVSGRHAEIRVTDGRYILHDNASTNGTFVNGRKIDGNVELRDGDKITFGAKGPQTEVRIATPGAKAAKLPARSTEQRIAIAVSKQTEGLKRAVIAAIVLVVVGGAAAVLFDRRASVQRVEELRKLLAANDSMRLVLQGSMRASGDTTLANDMQRKLADLRARLPASTTDAERQQIKTEIQELEGQLRRMVQMDLPTIHARNAPAVVILVSEIAGRAAAGSGFAITPGGLIVTNRHNVRDSAGRAPSRIAVKFTNTRDWLPAHVVKVSDTDDDLAMIQVDREGPFPVVAGVSSGVSDASEGMSVVTIGYPLGFDLPMEGAGNDFLAKSTLNPGTVSKKTSAVLQIDSYATHGSSGSPVFSTRGYIVGVVYGGQREAGGKIVYAVPPEKIAAFVPAEHKAIVKD
jgi:S1-C subfamily serine protease